MTLEQSLDLAELQADMAFETYLSAFEDGDHPEVVDGLATEAIIAQDCYTDLLGPWSGLLSQIPCAKDQP